MPEVSSIQAHSYLKEVLEVVADSVGLDLACANLEAGNPNWMDQDAAKSL